MESYLHKVQGAFKRVVQWFSRFEGLLGSASFVCFPYGLGSVLLTGFLRW